MLIPNLVVSKSKNLLTSLLAFNCKPMRTSPAIETDCGVE